MATPILIDFYHDGLAMPRVSPAVKSLYFNVPSTGDPAAYTRSFIDLSLATSAINRRFMRQGLNWAVGGFTFYNESANTGVCRISKLPDSWSVANAWVKAFNLWREMQDQVAEENESLRARYNDFKIYCDRDMVDANIQSSWFAQPGEILLPISGPQGTGQYVCKFGEWQYSDITIPNDPGNAGQPTDYALHMIGPDVPVGAGQSKGILLGYGNSRARPADIDPNITGVVGWMTNLFDDGEQLDEVQANFMDENDAPPYRVGAADPADVTHDKVYIPGASENLPNMEIHSALSFTATTVSAKQQIGGTTAQCGLLRLDTAGFDASTESASSGLFLQVHLVPGTHRGYMCQSMQDVN